jgi:hypothetical protein
MRDWVSRSSPKATENCLSQSVNNRSFSPRLQSCWFGVWFSSETGPHCAARADLDLFPPPASFSHMLGLEACATMTPGCPSLQEIHGFV